MANDAFAINGFTGMTQNEIISAWMMIVLFTVYAGLMAAALYAFYTGSRPMRGQMRTASLWYVGAGVCFMVSFITCIWAGPAEKSFVGTNGELFPSLMDKAGNFRFVYLSSSPVRFTSVVIGAGFAVIGLLVMAYGLRKGSRQRRTMTQAVIA